MPENPDAKILGDPLSYPPRKGQGESVSRQAVSNHPEGARRGETGLGMVDPDAKDVRILSADEVQEIMAAEDEALRNEFEESLRQLEQTGFPVPAWLKSVALWVLILFTGILGFFLVNQGIQFASTVSALNQPWQALAIAAAVIFGIMICVVVVRLAWLIFSLASPKGINLSALNTLAERGNLRLLAKEKAEEARRELKQYLADYSMDGAAQVRLRSTGITQKEIQILQRIGGALLDESRPMGSSQWLNEFRKNFQGTLDGIAARVVRKYARRAALASGASPLHFMDQLIILYASTAMIHDLLQLYNLRPAVGQATIILGRALIQTYLSGMIADTTEKAAEELIHGHEEWVEEVVGMAGAGVAAKVGLSKVAKGGLNALLIWRLGKQAVRFLQPVGTK